MNETEKQLYKGMKKTNYTNEDIRVLKNAIADLKSIDNTKVKSASVDYSGVLVKVGTKIITFYKDSGEF